LFSFISLNWKGEPLINYETIINLIGGTKTRTGLKVKGRKAVDNQVFEVHEPYSGKLFARVAAGSRVDGRAAVDAAAKAFAGWAETTPAEKARLFLKASEIVKRRRSEIAEVLARETGSTISFATFQQDLVAATLQQVAGWVYLPKGEVLETNAPGSHSIGVRRPLGVVASFTPWNGANVLSWRAVISPVAAGNTVVVKPSEFAPVSAGIMLAEVAEEAGFPAGVINVVTHAPGAAGATADEFFDRPEVRVINLIGALFGSFTYKSNVTGKEITSPFGLLARFEGDKVAYVQFLEDSYGTAGSFKTGGATRYHSDPSGKEVET